MNSLPAYVILVLKDIDGAFLCNMDFYASPQPARNICKLYKHNKLRPFSVNTREAKTEKRIENLVPPCFLQLVLASLQPF